MDVCSHCRAAIQPGARFCSQCGKPCEEYGSDGDTTQTVSPQPEAPAAVPNQFPTCTLWIATPDGLRPLVLPLGERLTLGRVDPLSSQQPDIDLTPYGAWDKGVSRRHAAIEFTGSAVKLIDLGSSNGTFLDGTLLTAYQAYSIPPGAQICLGRLAMQMDDSVGCHFSASV